MRGESERLVRKAREKKLTEPPQDQLSIPAHRLPIEELRSRYKFAIFHIETNIEETNPQYYQIHKPTAERIKEEIQKMNLTMAEIEQLNERRKEIYERQDREEREQEEWERQNVKKKRTIKSGLEHSPSYLVSRNFHKEKSPHTPKKEAGRMRET